MEEGSFSYDGYLVFTPTLANMSLSGNSSPESQKSILDTKDLPGFEPGDPEQPGKGFEEIDILSYSMSHKSSRIYNDFLDDVEYLQFKYEDFSESELFVDGQIRSGYSREMNTVDLFWFPSGLILFRGKKDSVNMAINFLEKTVSDMFIEYIDISPEFLLYIYESESISNHVTIRLNRIVSIEFEGDRDISKTKFSVGRNGDLRGHPLLKESRYPIALMATFEFLMTELLVNLRNSRFQVQSSSSDLSNYTEMERMLYSVLFSRILSEKILEDFYNKNNL